MDTPILLPFEISEFHLRGQRFSGKTLWDLDGLTIYKHRQILVDFDLVLMSAVLVLKKTLEVPEFRESGF